MSRTGPRDLAMAKRKSPFDRKLERLDALADGGQPAKDELAIFLADREPYVAGATASLIVELGLSEHVDLLAEALIRIVRGEQPDGGCMASDKIIDALLRLEANEPDAYRAGLGYVRHEPSGTAFVDHAGGVRVGCATGLIGSNVHGALQDVVPLLCDPEPGVRAGTVLALAQRRDEGAAACVHLRLRAGDPAPEVVGACWEALLQIDPDRYVPEVEAVLDDSRSGELGLTGELGPVRELAALALGESRHERALPILERALERGAAPVATLTLAIALTRSDAAIDRLVALVADAPESTALAAIEALGVHRDSASLADRLHRAVARRSKRLRAAVAESFGPCAGDAPP